MQVYFIMLVAILVCSPLSFAIDITPTPRVVSSSNQFFKLPSIVYAEEEFKPQAKALVSALKLITKENISFTSKPIGINLVKEPHLLEEEYRISIGSQIILSASTTTAMAHATASFLQLIGTTKQGEWVSLGAKIQDSPDYPFRCFMVDLGRNPHSPTTLRRVVDMLWLTKTNYLHLHLSDDQLFSFPSTAYPDLLSANAGWTLKDWQELEVYSQARGVTLIPELDVPAHSSILRKKYPRVFGQTPTELASLESSRKALTELLGEMMDVFVSSPFVHIGADEAAGVPEELQREFINYLNEFIQSRGRQTIAWEGPREGEGSNAVAQNVIFMNWRSVEFPPDDMLAAGHSVINATWDPLYIVDHYPRTMFTAVSSKQCYNFNIKRFKHVNPSFGTYHKPLYIRKNKALLGFCMPWWEGREENLFPICRQRINAVSARAWNDKAEKSFSSFLLRDAKLNILLDKIHPWKGETPTGGWPDQIGTITPGNLAHGKTVKVSSGGAQPLFHPQRLTNGITDPFDHFLGYPTQPKALEIVIDLGKIVEIEKVHIFEMASRESWEKYKLYSSRNLKNKQLLGEASQGDRKDKNNIVFTAKPHRARYIIIETEGCQNLTFPSFSRLCEVMVFAP